uniref:Uncharacterized protein n=1 Tax=Oryzias latipes TaxID=8090 RepID=A0A3B3I7A5_ORYLA
PRVHPSTPSKAHPLQLPTSLLLSPFVGHTVLSLDTQSCRWTHSPLFRTHSPFVGHTVLSLDTQSCRWTHSPLFRTHILFFGHTVLSLDTQSFLWTHSPVVGHTVLSSDTQSFRWTHSPFFGHTVLSLDTQSFFFGHTVLSLDTQSFLWTHSPVVGHTVLSSSTQDLPNTHHPSQPAAVSLCSRTPTYTTLSKSGIITRAAGETPHAQTPSCRAFTAHTLGCRCSAALSSAARLHAWTQSVSSHLSSRRILPLISSSALLD